MRPSEAPIEEVLDRAVGPRRDEADELVALLGEISGHRPVLWAGRMIGFGEYEYRYPAGMAVGRRNSLSRPARRITPSTWSATSPRSGQISSTGWESVASPSRASTSLGSEMSISQC